MNLMVWLNRLRASLQIVITNLTNKSESVSARKIIGNQGEAVARKYLKRKGWRLIAKNVRFGRDELDILAISPDEKILAIVEVRSTKDALKCPENTITVKKRYAMLRLANRMQLTAVKHCCELRVDVIAVRLIGKNPSIMHYEDVLQIMKSRKTA